MRNMSFFLTTPQFRARTKHVTRRLGWWDLKPGDVVMGIVKGQGIPKGGKVERLGPILIKSTKAEPLDAIKDYPADETALEGFPDKTAAEFVEMFCEHNNCDEKEAVNRIEFEYL